MRQAYFGSARPLPGGSGSGSQGEEARQAGPQLPVPHPRPSVGEQAPSSRTARAGAVCRAGRAHAREGRFRGRGHRCPAPTPESLKCTQTPRTSHTRARRGPGAENSALGASPHDGATIACTVCVVRSCRKRRESACGTPAVETTRCANAQSWREHQSLRAGNFFPNWSKLPWSI